MRSILLAAFTALAFSAPASALVIDYNSRAAFQAASGSLTLEDFEDSEVLPGDGIGVTGPVDAFSSNPAFRPGDIAAGLSINTVLQGPSNIAVIGNNFFDLGSVSVTVFANGPGPLRLDFSVPVSALGFDLRSLVQAQVQTIELFDALGSVGTWSVATPLGAGTFIGFTSTTSITSARINGPFFAGVDNIEFGNAAADVPEPASLGVLGLGLAALAFRRRRASVSG
jgi:hypothetical protein